jgi:hypothetical protein
MAPRVGLEPTTYRLTAGCSTIELSRNNTAEPKGIVLLGPGEKFNLAETYSPGDLRPKYHRRWRA